jgi:hypothetical protein
LFVHTREPTKIKYTKKNRERPGEEKNKRIERERKEEKKTTSIFIK